MKMNLKNPQIEIENEVDNNSLNNLTYNNHQKSVEEPILITSRKRGRPKKVKIPKDEIIITTENKSIPDTNNIQKGGKGKPWFCPFLRKRAKQINFKTLRNINVINSHGVELDNDYD